MDPRESSDWIAAELIEGLEEAGVACRFAGVLPTPAVARLCASGGYTFGAMISASHNPYEDNGIKFFSGDGFKLPDETEHHIEVALQGALGESSGPARPLPKPEPGLAGAYLEWLLSLWNGPLLAGTRVLVDGANGAASRLAPDLFRALGAEVETVACRPDGRNINAGCGSLHALRLGEAMAANGAQMAFAFDGDADRCMAVTRSGKVLDGDYVLYRDARLRAAQGRLPGRWVVGTVMSNLWLEERLGKEGLRFYRAPVGDRYVLQCLQDRGGVLGGEPSGHVLFLDRATTGDGLLTAMTYASLARDAGGLEALAEDVRAYPQVLENIRVAKRLPLEDTPAIRKALKEETEALAGRGRIVLRYSGTEPLLRLMVEAGTEEEVRSVIARLRSVLVGALGEG
jgi:phosphoglucosamine mutase